MDKPAQKTPLTTYPDDCSILLDLRDGSTRIAVGSALRVDSKDRDSAAVREYFISNLMYREEAQWLLDHELEKLLSIILEGTCMHFDYYEQRLETELSESASAAEDEFTGILWEWTRRLELERAFVGPDDWFEMHPPHLTSTSWDELERVADQAAERALKLDRILDPDEALQYLEDITWEGAHPLTGQEW